MTIINLDNYSSLVLLSKRVRALRVTREPLFAGIRLSASLRVGYKVYREINLHKRRSPDLPCFRWEAFAAAQNSADRVLKKKRARVQSFWPTARARGFVDSWGGKVFSRFSPAITDEGRRRGVQYHPSSLFLCWESRGIRIRESWRSEIQAFVKHR